MDNSGWIKLHRKMLDNPLLSGNRLALWVVLLLLADHEERDVMFKGERVPLKQGEFLTGRKFLAQRIGSNESFVERSLKLFENEQQIEQRKSNANRIITICNWEKYQKNEQRVNNEMNNERTTSEQRVNTYKNVKNVKNERNIGRFTPPTTQEVSAYCLERKNGIDGQYFCDYYTSRGWMIGKNKMKDWKSAIRTWENRNKKESKPIKYLT